MFWRNKDKIKIVSDKDGNVKIVMDKDITPRKYYEFVASLVEKKALLQAVDVLETNGYTNVIKELGNIIYEKQAAAVSELMKTVYDAPLESIPQSTQPQQAPSAKEIEIIKPSRGIL